MISVGKIYDIFDGEGLTESNKSKSSVHGMEQTIEIAKREFHGLCFVNLVDFDMLYGHRNDVDGYAAAMTRFDRWLAGFLPLLGEEDLLMITADHGCDPGDDSTDHTREYTPLLIYGKKVIPTDLGTRKTFADIAATIAELLQVDYPTEGTSMAKRLLEGGAKDGI